MKIIFTLFMWSYAIVTCILLFPINFVVFLLTYPFDKGRRVIHEMSRFWSLQYYWIAPGWTVDVEGKDKIDKNDTYIIVSNHQSLMDICLLYVIPLNFRWVSKAEVKRFPIVGWMLSVHGDITIHRGHTESTKKMNREVEKWIDRKVSISMFPEGTRTKDGEIHRFKEGAFVMAKKNNIKILPVVTNGNYYVMSKGSWTINPIQKFKVRILDPIPLEVIQAKTSKELAQEVQDIMNNVYQKIVTKA